MVPWSSIDLDELAEHWTVLNDQRTLVDAKHGGLRLGFALLLKHYTRYGRCPTEVTELPDAAIEFVARQLQVPAVNAGAYEWTGRLIERHQAQIREHLGFRECTVADAEQLTAWLAERSRALVDNKLCQKLQNDIGACHSDLWHPCNAWHSSDLRLPQLVSGPHGAARGFVILTKRYGPSR